MDAEGPGEMTDQAMLQALSELAAKLKEDQEEGFTTREWCRFRGLDPSSRSDGYRRGLEELKKLRDAGVIESGVSLARTDVHNRATTIPGWRVLEMQP